MTFPTYGTERDDTFQPARCVWCSGNETDGDLPCGDDACERMAVRASRQRRVAGFKDAIAKATTLYLLYIEESGPASVRAQQTLGQIHDYERAIADATEAQEREDEATADTVRAPMAVTS